MAKISVIITTFNRAQMLRRAIASVLRQTLSDFELLILDNSSTDNTEQVARFFNDPRICYIKHPATGISGARNLGLREAKTDYIAFLDDDDEFLPKKLELQYEVMEKDGTRRVAFVYGAYAHIYQDTGKIYETIYPAHRGNVYEYAVSHRDTFSGSASNPLLKKSAVLDVGGYDEEIKTGEDYEMFLRLAKKYDFDFVNELVVNVYFHRGYRLSWRLADYLNNELIVFHKHEDFIKKHSIVHAFYLQIIGGKYFRLGKPKEARQYFLKAFRLQPLRVSIWAQFILSFFPLAIYKFFHRLAVFGEDYLRRLRRGQ